MAMPASGCIAIIDNTIQTCSSICAAVGVASGSLSTLSVAAGKSAPHAMTEFYGYSPATPVDWNYVYYNGGDNSTYSYSYFKPTCPTTAGQCYCLCTFFNLCVDPYLGFGSWARMCVRCNGGLIYNCCIDYNGFCVNTSYAVTVRANDNICFYNYASETPAQLGYGVRSQVCISSIVNIVGSFSKGTTCQNICRYTAN